MATSAHLFHFHSPQFLNHRSSNSINNSNNSTTSSLTSPCSPSPYSSYPNTRYHRRGHSWNFAAFSGLNNIWKHRGVRARSMSTSQGNVSSPRGFANTEDEPDHLLVLVHGILASPRDWIYFEAELKRRLGKKFLIYASSCNTFTKTFTGIDGAGKRLADEVMQVVRKTESLKKISFLAHSLGGLFARYAVAVLYAPNVSSYQSDDITGSPREKIKTSSTLNKGSIAGLEAINFITLATPHLGVRGNKQVSLVLSATIPIWRTFLGETCCSTCPDFYWPNWQPAVPHRWQAQ